MTATNVGSFTSKDGKYEADAIIKDGQVEVVVMFDDGWDWILSHRARFETVEEAIEYAKGVVEI